MTSVHHIEFWGKGGQNNLPNLIPLCYHHHRLVHEGGWQVIKAGEEIRWIPPDRMLPSFRGLVTFDIREVDVDGAGDRAVRPEWIDGGDGHRVGAAYSIRGWP